MNTGERKKLKQFIEKQEGQYVIYLDNHGSWLRPWRGEMTASGLTVSWEQYGAVWKAIWRARSRTRLLEKMWRYVAKDAAKHNAESINVIVREGLRR